MSEVPLLWLDGAASPTHASKMPSRYRGYSSKKDTHRPIVLRYGYT